MTEQEREKKFQERIDRGEVIERGTYADLVRLGGRYASMLEQQMLTPPEVVT